MSKITFRQTKKQTHKHEQKESKIEHKNNVVKKSQQTQNEKKRLQTNMQSLMQFKQYIQSNMIQTNKSTYCQLAISSMSN